jgi:gliding motility-associated-like protein
VVHAQNICDVPINPVCSSDTFNVQAPDSSYDGYIESCDGNIYDLENVVWYEMRVLEGNTFTFLIELNLGDDYDFAVWKNPNCENLGIPDRASFIHEPWFEITHTGLLMNELDECEGLGENAYNEPGYVRHLDVVPGDRILLMIQRPIVTSSGYEFNVVFENTGGNAVLDCSIVGNVYPKCDTDGNGFESFQKSEFLLDLENEYPTSLFSFYETHSEAMLGNMVNTVGFPIQVNTTESPKFLFVRIEDADGIFDRVIQISLVVNPIPVLNNSIQIELCDDDFNGQFTYNLNLLPTALTSEFSSLEFHYYTNFNNAINQQNELNSNEILNYEMTTLPHTIWVVATNEFNCQSNPVSVQFVQANSISTTSTTFGPIAFCSGERIDLTEFESIISTETNLIFSYFENILDAQENQSPISNTQNYLAEGTGSVFVRIDHENLCSVLVEVKFKENLNPEILDLPTQIEICETETKEITVSTSMPNTTITWMWGENQTFIGNTLEISDIGIYVVKVESIEGCFSERELVVIRPPQPTITAIEYGPNYVIFNAVSGGESGTLEYSLDEIFWQSSPQFHNLQKGVIYTVFVREDGCMKDSYDFVLLSIPNFISPNGDGINDSWEIRGIESSPQATIKIFDRYGKIFVDTHFEGNYRWDGKYLGRPVPSGDYWYIMEIPTDGIIKAHRFVGHIAVRNQ